MTRSRPIAPNRQPSRKRSRIGMTPMDTDREIGETLAAGRSFAGKSAGCCAKVREVWLPKPATRWVPQVSCSLARNVVTKVRTDQGRGYAIVRIFTGEALFYER